MPSNLQINPTVYNDILLAPKVVFIYKFHYTYTQVKYTKHPQKNNNNNSFLDMDLPLAPRARKLFRHAVVHL